RSHIRMSPGFVPLVQLSMESFLAEPQPTVTSLSPFESKANELTRPGTTSVRMRDGLNGLPADPAPSPPGPSASAFDTTPAARAAWAIGDDRALLGAATDGRTAAATPAMGTITARITIVVPQVSRRDSGRRTSRMALMRLSTFDCRAIDNPA